MPFSVNNTFFPCIDILLSDMEDIDKEHDNFLPDQPPQVYIICISLFYVCVCMGGGGGVLLTCPDTGFIDLLSFFKMYFYIQIVHLYKCFILD